MRGKAAGLPGFAGKECARAELRIFLVDETRFKEHLDGKQSSAEAGTRLSIEL